MNISKIEDLIDIELDGYDIPESVIKRLSEKLEKEVYTHKFPYLQDLILKLGYDQKSSYEFVDSIQDKIILEKLNELLFEARFRNTSINKNLIENFNKYILRNAWNNERGQMNEYPNLAQTMLEYMDINELEVIKELIKNDK